MDEYFGMRIKFVTRGGPVHGVLRGLDEEKELFKIVIGEEEFKLDIHDVVDMEPVEEGEEEEWEGGESVVRDRKEEICVKEKETSIKEKGTGVESIKEEEKGKEECIKEEICVKEKEECIKEKEASIKEEMCTQDKSSPTYSLSVSHKHFQDILRLSFCRFGPTREEFISTGSLNLFKMVKSYFKVNSRVDIVLGENTLYSSIGLSLGRHLLTNGYDVQVVGSPRDLEIVKYFYLYRENKGVSSPKLRDNLDFVINTSETRGVEGGSPIVFTFGGKSKGGEDILVCFGASTLERVKGVKMFYLLDVMITESVYRKFNLSRRNMRSINRIKE